MFTHADKSFKLNTINKQMFTTFTLLILVSILFAGNSKASSPVPNIFPNTMVKINETRKSLGFDQIKTDDDLCQFAYQAATQMELAYPKVVLGINDPAIKKYTKRFSSYYSITTTTSDIVIKAMKIENKQSINDGYLEKFADKDNKLVNLKDITHGCVAASPGGMGYKQFAIFVVGIEKSNNVVISIFDSLKLMVMSIFGIGNKPANF